MSKRKRSKLRRSFPKRFASDNIQGKNKNASYKHKVPPDMEGILDYRQRAKSLSFDEPEFFANHRLSERLYTKEEVAERNKLKPIPVMPETGYQILEAEDQSPPVFRVAELLDKWQSPRLNGFNEFKYYIVLLDMPDRKIKLFQSGLKACFVKEMPGETVRSNIYESKERAMSDFVRNKVKYYFSIT